MIRFDRTGHLGLATNGAAPDVVVGFQIEAEVHHGEGAVTHAYFLRPVTEVFADGRVAQTQNFLSSDDPQRFERLLSTMCDVVVRGTGEVTLVGKYDGWRNWSQNDFDQDLDEECVYDLSAKVGRSPQGQLEVTLV